MIQKEKTVFTLRKILPETTLAEISVISFLQSLFICCFLLNEANAQQNFIVSGVSGGPDNINVYHGAIRSFKGTLSESGPAVRLFGKTATFFFETDLPGGLQDVPIQAIRFAAEGDIGWQFVNDYGRLAVFGGIVWREHDLNPNDPTSRLVTENFGFSATVDGDIHVNDQFGIAANASYVTEFDEVWAQAKPYTRIKRNWKIGPQFAFARGPDFINGRAGFFLSDVKIDIPKINSTLYLGLEAGAIFDIQDQRMEAFGGLNIAYELFFFSG